MKFRDYTAAIYRTAALKARRDMNHGSLHPDDLTELNNLEAAMGKYERDHRTTAEKGVAGFFKS